jgi:5-formyltetrahydrofolate cyclo-ligase
MTDKRAIRAAARAARATFVAGGAPGLAVPAEFEALLPSFVTPALSRGPAALPGGNEEAGSRVKPGVTVRSPILATYAPLGDEADPAPLARAAMAAGYTLALPHVVDRATPIRFLAWHPEDALAAGPFGLRQPADGPAVAPDIILTPLVAFDAALNRVGQGAGHYDRAFAAFPDAKRIGVAYSVQQVAPLVPDPWDMPLDAIVTERGWLTR